MTARMITTAAEFAALPVGSVVRNLSRGITAERLADGRGVIPGNPTACPWGSLWSAGSHIVVLYDPSDPAHAPSVVPEAAPSATREAVEAVIFEADDECVLEVHEVRSLASRLLARYNMTPKEDR